MHTLLSCKCAAIALGMLICAGCSTTYEASRTSAKTMRDEGSIVFVRPDRYSILGTRSIRDYIEITYEQLSVNDAGYPVLKVGLRNRGGQHFWDWEGPGVQLSVQTAFYDRPIQPDGAASGSAAYRTNWRAVKLTRGQTSDYEITCPVEGANYYQMTISEYLK